MSSERDPSASRGPDLRRQARQFGQSAILIVALVAPIAIGGARPDVQVVLTAAAVLAGAVWLFARRGDVRLPPFGGVALAALGFTLFQLVPLPAAVVDLVSSNTLALRSDALGARPRFLPLSLDVPATLLAAMRGLACLLVLAVAASSSRRGNAQLLLAPLAVLGGALAVVCFVQRGLGVDKILGFYEVADMPGSGFFGTFVAGNNAAAFFTLTALLGVGLARESDGWLRGLFGACALLSMAVIFSTGSRFSILGLAAGGLLMLALYLVRAFGRLRGLIATAVALVIALPLAVSLALAQRNHGGDGLPLTDFKLRGWRDAVDLALAFPLAGVGRGAFEGPAAAYRKSQEHVRLVFPENLTLQMTTEWGLPVSLALVVLFVLAAWPVARRLPRWEPSIQAAAAAVVAALVHDLADFSLEVLGVALPVALTLGVLAGRRQMSLDSTGRGQSQPVSVTLVTRHPVLAQVRGSLLVVLAAGLVAGGAWASSRTVDADAELIRASIRRRAPETNAQIAAAIARHPAEHEFALLAARWALRVDPPDPSGLRQLNRAQRLFPSSPTPHVLTAHVLVRNRLAPQAAIELRLANDLGANLGYEQMERMVGPANLERAVPRDSDRLFALASYLIGRKRPAEAAQASERAVLLAESSEASLVRRTEIALASGDKAFIADATYQLARGPTSSAGFEIAIRGLAAIQDLTAAEALVRRAGHVLPHDGSLVVTGARLLMQSGGLTHARTLISESATRNLSVQDRIAGEEVLAEIADREGDSAAAAAARARARILVQMRNQNSH